MRVLLLASALLFAVPASAQQEPIVAPAPAWIVNAPKAANPASVAELPADAPVAILSFDHQVRFAGDGDHRYVASAVKLLTPQGLAAMGTVALSWRPDSGTLTIHKLQIVRGTERIDVLAKQKFTVLRREGKLEESILDGILTATLQPEGLQVGDILEIAFTQTQRDPVLGSHSELSADFPSGLPGTKARLLASWQADRPVRWRSTTQLPQPRKWTDNGVQFVEWTADGLPALKGPKGAPLRYLPVYRVEFTQFGAWSDLAALLAPHYQKAVQIKDGSPLAAQIARLKSSGADPKVQAAAALKLVQDQVRYVYRGMNEGNLSPARADETWTRRFGDCKGKTALLLALLNGLGIDAEAALVSTAAGDGLDARLPMAVLFDHVLVRASIGGKVYWLDGTRDGDGALDDIAAPSFHWALPLRGAGAQLLAIEQRPLARPGSEIDIWIDAKAGVSLPAPIEITTITRGDEAQVLRQQLAALSADQADAALKSYWKKRYSFVTPDKVSAGFDDRTGEHKITLEGKADLTWEAGQGYELDGASLGWELDTERDPGTDADAPFAVAFPYYVKTRERIILPRRGVGFSVKGDDVARRELAGFEFARTVKIEGELLTMESSSRALKPEISAKEARDAAPAMKAMSNVRVMVMAPHDYAPTSAEVDGLAKIVPTTADGWIKRGNGLLDSGQLDEAIADFDKALKLDENNALAWANRGLTKAWKQQNEQALDDLDRAAAIDPRLPYIFHGRAIVLQNQGELGAASAALSRAIDLLKDNIWAYGRRARISFALAEYAKVIADADAMLAIQPSHSRAQQLRWRALAASGDVKTALAAVDEAISRSADPEALWTERARLLIAASRGEEARALLARLRAKSSRTPPMLNELCWTQAGANFDLALAQADCAAALKIAPGAPPVLDSLALVLLRQGKFDEAIARYTEALAKAPTQAQSLYGRGLAKLRKGDKLGAEVDLKAATAKDALVASEFREMGLTP